MTHNAKAIKSRKLWHLIKMRLGNGRTPKRIKRSSNWDENTVRNISFASEISIKTANPCLPKTQRLWIVESGWIHHTFCFVFFYHLLLILFLFERTITISPTIADAQNIKTHPVFRRLTGESNQDEKPFVHRKSFMRNAWN